MTDKKCVLCEVDNDGKRG